MTNEQVEELCLTYAMDDLKDNFFFPVLRTIKDKKIEIGKVQNIFEKITYIDRYSVFNLRNWFIFKDRDQLIYRFIVYMMSRHASKSPFQFTYFKPILLARYNEYLNINDLPFIKEEIRSHIQFLKSNKVSKEQKLNIIYSFLFIDNLTSAFNQTHDVINKSPLFILKFILNKTNKRKISKEILNETFLNKNSVTRRYLKIIKNKEKVQTSINFYDQIFERISEHDAMEQFDVLVGVKKYGI